MLLERQRLTAADMRALEALPENADKRFELIDGEMTELATGTILHSLIATLVAHFLNAFAIPLHLGYAFGDNTTYTLSPHNRLIPDASFVRAERLSVPLPVEFEFAPDIAVEVVSPSNSPRQLLTKIETYIEFGTRMVWAFHPEERVIDVYRPADGGGLLLRKVTADMVLDGGDVLPGFSVETSLLFPELNETSAG